jgi:bifunctional non-homologous end joining protein LigD
VTKSGEQWVHEVKHDGYRLMARKVDGRVRLYTKQGMIGTGNIRSLPGALPDVSDLSGARRRGHVLHQRHA